MDQGYGQSVNSTIWEKLNPSMPFMPISPPKIFGRLWKKVETVSALAGTQCSSIQQGAALTSGGGW